MLTTILLILALICFIMAAAGYPEPHAPKLTPLGLAFWVLTIIIAKGG